MPWKPDVSTDTNAKRMHLAILECSLATGATPVCGMPDSNYDGQRNTTTALYTRRDIRVGDVPTVRV